MDLVSRSFAHNAPIPDRCALAKPDPDQRVTFSDNRSPDLSWGPAPEGVRSYVLLCVDVDVPTVGDDVNREGRVVPRDLPRCDFNHWVMVDIPAAVEGLSEGACGSGVVPHGKSDPPGPAGSRQGKNDYTGWFSEDPDMAGTYLGYDGPGPPWNDERVHRYEFRLYALDLEHCPVVGAFTSNEVLAAVEGHVLASAVLVGTYTLNPALRAEATG